MLIKVLSFATAPVFDLIIAEAKCIPITIPVVGVYHCLPLLHIRTRGQLHIVYTIAYALLLHDLTIGIVSIGCQLTIGHVIRGVLHLTLPHSLWFPALEYRILPHLLLSRLLHSLELLLFIELLTLATCHLDGWFFIGVAGSLILLRCCRIATGKVLSNS